VLGGEVFTAAFEKEISRHLKVAHITNLYGPTEATIDAIGFAVEVSNPMRASDRASSVQLPGLCFWMVVWSLFLLGLLGSFTLRVVGLGAGYVGRGGLTASVLLRTGLGLRGSRMLPQRDLARWRGMGFWSFVGRADHQVRFAASALSLGRSRRRLLRH